jgi:electron transfer flavoprotein beta subunit
VNILFWCEGYPLKDAPLKLATTKAGVDPRRRLYEVNEPTLCSGRGVAAKKSIPASRGHRRACALAVLREGLAGRDRAIHLEDNGFVGLTLSTWPRPSSPPSRTKIRTLIFTGLQSDDYGYAQTGVIWRSCRAGRMPPSSWRSRN